MLQSFHYKNVDISYRIEGNGPRVLLVHGFGEDGNVWNAQVEFLKAYFQVIIPDLPGSGKSAMIPDMSMEGMAEMLAALIEKVIGNGKAVPVIAHSMGGYISLALLDQHSEYINALGLFHSSAFADTEEKKAARQKGIEAMQAHGAATFLEVSIPNLFSQGFKDERPENVDEFIKQQRNFRVEALVSYYQAMINRPDRTVLLRERPIPFLFIMGKYDNAVPFADSLKQCHLPEKSYIHILRNSGHMGMMEETEKANKIIYDFLMEVCNKPESDQ